MRVFAPLIFLYLIGMWAIARMLAPGLAWNHQVYTRVGWRMLLYPAILLSIFLLAFALIGFLVDQGYSWTLFALPVIVVAAFLGIIKLASVMVGDVRRVLYPTDPKEK